MNDTSSTGAKPDLISIVVPAYNEADGIAEFSRRLADVRAKLPERSEVVYVNDGSRDDTFAILRLLRERDPTISIVNLSRNFGKEIALTAGLDHSHGDAVIVMDADLQDLPELIPTLIKHWYEDGADVVFAQRRSRAGESWFKKATAYGSTGQQADGPRRYGRFRASQPTSGRRGHDVPRAAPLHEGPVCETKTSALLM
jgi:glycosyltransferase involved in cell wall biosynthesis